MRQKDVRLSGWAVESRIYAEDPFRNFLPSIGRLVRYRPPEEGTDGEITVRCDTGVVEGSEISMFYDPMIAKLVTHAPTRDEAIDAQADALDAFVIDGIQHNIPFLSALQHHPNWREGRLSTGFIAEVYPHGFGMRVVDEGAKPILAAAAVAMEVIRQDRLEAIPGRLRPATGDMRTDWVVKLDRTYIPVTIAEGFASIPLELDMVIGEAGIAVTVVSRWQPGDGLWIGQISGGTVTIQVRPVPNGMDLRYRGFSVVAKVMTPRIARFDRLMPEKAPPDTSRLLLCPMPGLVVTIDVIEGQAVKAGETLAIVEAMKMQNVLRAERDLTVKTIKARPGDSLAVDAVIMEFA
jgi:propionyl-CoA carboxylase alpha chain